MSGGLIDPGGSSIGKKAKQAEMRRQSLIGSGMGLIDAAFYGGTVPMYTPFTDEISKGAEWQSVKAGDFDFYKPDKMGGFAAYTAPRGGENSNTPGLALIPGSMPKLSSLTGGQASAREILNRKIKQGKLFTRQDQSFEGYQPSFFNQRAQDYVNFALPQLQQQYGNNFRSIMYNLANRGLLRSTTREKAMSDLNVAAGQGAQAIYDTGRGQAQQLRNDLESARQNAINMLYQTADPGRAMQTALAAGANASAPSTFAPIANMFSNLANQYYMSQVLQQYQGGVPAYSINMNSNPLSGAIPEND
jgi:hypothetical protein